MIKPLLIATLAAIVAAFPAHAEEGPAGDNPEDNYLYVRDSEGINPTNDSDAETAGYAHWEEIASGAMPRTLMNSLSANAPDLSAYQVEVVVDSAVTWLCPAAFAGTSPTADAGSSAGVLAATSNQQAAIFDQSS